MEELGVGGRGYEVKIILWVLVYFFLEMNKEQAGAELCQAQLSFQRSTH